MTHPLEMRFAILEEEQTALLGGYKIVVITDHACHLYLRWTIIEPQKHHVPIERRGAPVGTIIDQCFVVYHDVAQDEHGDTYIHTFYLFDWPECQYRWFYFWGTVGGVLSPSLSPIFEKHYRGWTLGPEQTTDLYMPHTSPESRRSTGLNRYYPGDTWEELWPKMASHNPGHRDIGNIEIYQQGFQDAMILVDRYCQTWDLAPIPDNHRISKVTMHFYTTTKSTVAHHNSSLTLINAHPDDPDDPQLTDMHKCDYRNIVTPVAYADVWIGAFTIMTLLDDDARKRVPGEMFSTHFLEHTYDKCRCKPPWDAGGRTLYRICGPEADPAERPFLRITHQEATRK